MDKDTLENTSPDVVVKAWERDPGTVLEISISKPLSIAGMEQLVHLCRSTVRLILDLSIVKDA